MDNITELKSYSFAEVLQAPSHFICDLKLYPFSLAHYLSLENFSSPLLSNTPNSEEFLPYDNPRENDNFLTGHLLLFLVVCAHDYANNKRLIEDVDFFNETKSLFEAHISNYIKKQKNWGIHIELEKINEYLQYYIGDDAMPQFVEIGPPSNKPPSGLDWKQNIYSVLATEYGYDEEKIMNLSMRRVFAEWVVMAAKSGSIEVKNKQLIEMERKMAEKMEQKREELKKKEMA